MPDQRQGVCGNVVIMSAEDAAEDTIRPRLLVAQDPDDNRVRVLAVTKCNLAAKPASLRFALEPVGNVCRIGWMGTSSYHADDLVQTPATEEEKQAREEAKTKVELWCPSGE